MSTSATIIGVRPGGPVPVLYWQGSLLDGPASRRPRLGYRTTVQVAPRGLPGAVPLEIRVRTRGGLEVTRVELDPGGGSWTFTSLEPVRDVRINADRGLLAETQKVRRLRGLPQR